MPAPSRATVATVLAAVGVFLPAVSVGLDGTAIWAGREDFPRYAFPLLAVGVAAFVAQIAVSRERGGARGVALAVLALAAWGASLLLRDVGRTGLGWEHAGAAFLNLAGNVAADLQVVRALTEREGTAPVEIPWMRT